MNDHSCYWQFITLEPAICSDISFNRVDVIVVGGGLMGVSVAYWLARYGANVLVVEQKKLAWSASGRNGGIVTIGPADEYIDAIRKFGRSVTREITQSTVNNHQLLENVLAEEQIEANYYTGGFLSLACSEAELRTLTKSTSLMHSDGFSAQMIERSQCEHLMGTRLGKRFIAGSFSPDDGMIQPVAYVQGLAQAAIRRGAKFLINTFVTSLSRESHRWLISTSQGSFTAEQIVLATGEDIEKLLPPLEHVIQAVYDRIIVTEPTTIQMQVSWAANKVSEYGRQANSGALLIGGFSVNHRGKKNFDLQKTQACLAAYTSKAFPELYGLRAITTWVGTMAVTIDNLPIVGAWPKEKGLWLITGFGGHGLPFSQVVPCSLAKAIISQSSADLPSYYSPQRFFRDSNMLGGTAFSSIE
ncbi:MAG TPA: FAD-binding oxidoreductase [Ktedonosporobacter sp.]|jgi:glycine/D-amino acid oxidase-like deaminating enzyme|nr:FAD-binding oxidoreductase [Ktedonosporobacter sp.]